MEKRYQVFISSTFRDLIDERQAVLRGILELDHIPAGMELFPATSAAAWELIRDVIDNSDYYLVIIGGRYGSIGEQGISYTEMEYDYAISARKPVIALLHNDPTKLLRDKTDTDEETWTRLQEFRAKVEDRHTCSYWETADDLMVRVVAGISAAVKRNPAVGWVRSDQVPSGAAIADALALRERVSELEAELDRVNTTPPPGTENLMQGEDEFELHMEFRGTHKTTRRSQRYSAKLEVSWNKIFSGVAPVLINEASESQFRSAFRRHFEQLAIEEFIGYENLQNRYLDSFEFRDDEIDTCLVQLRALGLIRESDRKRSVRDTATYWTLTKFGDLTMVQHRAVHRTPPREKYPNFVLGHVIPSDDP